MNTNINGLLREINTESFLKDELLKTVDILRRNIEERYINRVRDTISSAKKETLQAPTKETGLLMAMREFSDGVERERFDRAIEFFNGLNTISNIQNDMKQTKLDKSMYSLSDDNNQNDVSDSLFNMLLILVFMNVI